MVLDRMGFDIQITYDSTYWNRTCVYGSYMTKPRYIVGLGMEAMNWPNSINYKEMSKDFKLPCKCPICLDLKDDGGTYSFFNNYKVDEKTGEEQIVFGKFNNMIAFHNLYLQLEYLENINKLIKLLNKSYYLILIISIIIGISFWIGFNVNLLPEEASINAPIYDELFKILFIIGLILSALGVGTLAIFK